VNERSRSTVGAWSTVRVLSFAASAASACEAVEAELEACEAVEAGEADDVAALRPASTSSAPRPQRLTPTVTANSTSSNVEISEALSALIPGR